MIEAWGRGFDKIKEACQKYDGPLPEYDISEDGIMVLCKACERYLKILRSDIKPIQSEQDDEQNIMKAIVIFCTEPKSSQEIIEHFRLPNRSYFKRHYLDKLVKTNKLKMTIPEKPSSKNQKYYSMN